MQLLFYCFEQVKLYANHFYCMFRNQQTAKIFAIKYGIPNAMAGYEALAACNDVNVVYVGTINTTHLDVVKVIKFG